MKQRFTKMDILVLAVVLALIAGAFVKAGVTESLPESRPFTYQMEATDIQGEIAPGDTVLCMTGKQSVGTVTEVHTDGGRTVLTLEASGTPVAGGFHAHVYDILPGFEDDFYTESAVWYGIVTDVS